MAGLYTDIHALGIQLLTFLLIVLYLKTNIIIGGIPLASCQLLLDIHAMHNITSAFNIPRIQA